MRIAALEAFGIDDQVIDLWREVGHETLLPIQENAVREGKVLDGRNILVFSPTSSGKTFVGEMAAIKTARQNKRVIYLVPQKALAEEKYTEFRNKYGSLGVRIVISTRDRREFDQDINRGHFHIAVIVFEKMQGLLVSNPSLLRNVGLVIVDELQMIGDSTRGANLEILLTKIKISDGGSQIVGLSAVLGNSEGLAKWLNAELCRSNRRPVELRKGVLWNGTFHYLEHNGGEEGHESLLRVQDEDANKLKILVSNVRHFAETGEQCLVFCKSKQECINTAAEIIREIDTKEATSALAELADLEDSRGKDILVGLLKRGVAYHNADLDWEQRDLIERWFRRGEIAVLCSTTTLALGMNLPAKNVFIDPDRWDRDSFGRWNTVPISQAEYENISGRAGRLGLEENFGRAILVTDSKFEAGNYYNNFVKGSLGDIEPALVNDPLAQHVLNLVASKICRTQAEIRQVLLSSFTGELLWKGPEKEEEFDGKLSEGLQQCLNGGLIEMNNGLLTATDLGKLTAIKGISVDTAIKMAKFAKAYSGEATDLHLFEILWCLTGTEDGERIYFNQSSQEYNSREYSLLLKSTTSALPAEVRERLSAASENFFFSYEGSKRVKKTLMLYEWVTDVPTREIEVRYHCFTGSIVNMAREFSWLTEAFSAIAKLCDWRDNEVGRLRALSTQMIHGISEDAVEISKARVRGLGRGRVKTLMEKGLNTLEKIAQSPRQQLEKLLTKPVAKRLLHQITSLFRKQEAQQNRDEHLERAQVQEQAEMPEEVVEWEENFPPSDDLGITYLTNANIQIDGRANKRRHLIYVGGKESWLTERSFEAALRLAVASKTTELGWASGHELGEPDTYHQVIRRLKTGLKKANMDVDKLIENNGAKQYRFSTSPRNITIDGKMVLRHLPEFKNLIGELETVYGS